MFSFLKNFKKAQRVQSHLRGYEYAAGELLSGRKSPFALEAEICRVFEPDNPFDDGMDDAIHDAINKGLCKDDRV